MQCWNCGATVRPGAKICVYCGERLSAGAEGTGTGRGRRGERDSHGDRGFQAPWRSRYADPNASQTRDYQEPEDDGGAYDLPEDSRDVPAHGARTPRTPSRAGREQARDYGG